MQTKYMAIALAGILGLSPASVAHATKYWRNGVVTGNWNTATNWSSISASDTTTSGVPVASEAVNIVHTDGTSRTVTYNVNAPTLGLLSIDLTGAGTTTNTLSMPNNNNLTAAAIAVGGYNGAVQTSGRGAIIQSAGTTTTSPGGDLILGWGSNSTGTYTLNGGAVVANQNELIGYSGTGTFNHTAGMNTINASALGSFIVGVNAGSTGTYNLSGTGSLAASANEYVGYEGVGTFTQSGGTNTISGAGHNLYVGYNASGTSGVYTLSGGSLSVSGDEVVGYNHSGTFNQSDGTNTVSTDLRLGSQSGSTGTYNLSGPSSGSGGADLTTNGNQYIGDIGTGIFNHMGGGNHVVGNLYLGYNATGTGGTYTLSSGTANVFGDEYVGYAGSGTFIQSGGANNLFGPTRTLYVGYNSGAIGTYTMSGGSFGTALSQRYIGYFGTGVFNNTGGSDLGSLQIIVGRSGTGTYNLSGDGILDTANLFVGQFSTGTFNQSSGTSRFSTNLQIATSAGSTGAFNLSGGSATVNFGSNCYVGGSNSAPGGTGTFTVSGTGNLTVTGQLQIYNTAGTSVNLSGGTINAAALNFNGTPSLFHWNSGTLNVTSNVTWDAAAAGTTTGAAFGSSLTLAASRTLMVTGNETLGGTGAFGLTLNGGSTHTVTGGLTINPTGAFALNGGTVSASSLNFNGNPSLFNWITGKLNLTSDVTWDSAAVATTTSAAFGTARTLGANQTLMITGNETLGGAGGFGLTLNAGSTHTVTGSSTINPTGTLALGGGTLSTSSLINNGIFLFDSGTLNITNQAVTIASGEVLGNTLDLAHDMTVNVTLGITNQGLVTGDGEIGGSFANSAGGELRAEPGKSLKLIGDNNTNLGQINLYGGLLEFTQDLTNNSGAFISGNGTLNATGGLTNHGTMNFSGLANVVGDVTNSATGKIISSGGGPTTFFDDVINNGEIRTSTNGFTVFFGDVSGGGSFTGAGTVNFEGDLSPGNSPAAVSFAGDVVLGPAAVLEIELGGTTLGTYDQILVTGDLVLDGLLDVSILPGFTPGAGQSFNILDWGTLDGEFFDVNLPTLAGLTWDTSLLYESGELSLAAAGLLGDYNGNNQIDAADYTVWRDALTAGSMSLTNDPTPGTVDESDFLYWRAHFGETLGSGSGARQAAVPEPSSLVLLILAGAGWGLPRRRTA